MKKILISAMMLVACYTQAQQPSVGHDYCSREYTMIPVFDGNIIVKQVDITESISTVEDMIEWITQDTLDGNIDQLLAETYLWNLDEILTRLKTEEEGD